MNESMGKFMGIYMEEHGKDVFYMCVHTTTTESFVFDVFILFIVEKGHWS